MLSGIPVLIALVLFIPLQAHSGPFGWGMGMSKEDIGTEITPTSTPYVYSAKTAPKPNRNFESYMVVITPDMGLCKVIAVGVTVKTSVYGTELKSTFDNLEEMLKAAYGRNARYDFLGPGSIWNEPNDWMMALLKKERRLTAIWLEANGSTLKNNVSAILLEATALSMNQGYVSLSYEFTNFERCKRTMDDADRDSL